MCVRAAAAPSDSTTSLLHTFALLDSHSPLTHLSLQDSSFEVISLSSRSSSGFCEKWAGPERPDDTHPGVNTDNSSCFVDLDANGDVVALAMGELELSDTQPPLVVDLKCPVGGIGPELKNDDLWNNAVKAPEQRTPYSELGVGGRLPGITPATSTPKKTPSIPMTPVSPLHLMQEGRFRANCYHRDGTSIGTV